jgi:hypothetical protein
MVRLLVTSKMAVFPPNFNAFALVFLARWR